MPAWNMATAPAGKASRGCICSSNSGSSIRRHWLTWRRRGLRIETRLLRSRLVKTDDYTPGLHAAQFQIFFTLQNFHPGSPGRGRYLWFGLPIYDDRQRVPAAHKAQDTGGTKMFIFTPGGGYFTAQSAHDRQWIAIDKDLLPLMREALETAGQCGFLTESKTPADYRISGMNLGCGSARPLRCGIAGAEFELTGHAKSAFERVNLMTITFS